MEHQPNTDIIGTVAVIGAGITGLVYAREVQKNGGNPVVLEASERTGGAVKTIRRDGWILEAGPNTVLVTNTLFQNLIDELGLKDNLLVANPAAKNRYIVKDSVPYSLPSSPIQFFSTPLFGWKTKVGLLKEPFIRRGDDSDEDLASFVNRRLGQEFLDYAINPFVAGVFAGKPELLSVRHAFPKLYNIEQQYGSLIKGALFGKKNPNRTDIPRSKAQMISFRNGNEQLSEVLEKTIGAGCVYKSEKVYRISRTENGYRVETENGRIFRADSVVSTVPVYQLSKIEFEGLSETESLKRLQNVEYPPVSVVHLGYLRNQVRHPLDGFGMLVPEREKRNILGALFNSTLFDGRTPDENHVLITVFTGGKRNPEIAALDDASLLENVTHDLNQILGIHGVPVTTQVTRWPNAIPQYATGYGTMYQAMENIEQANPGFYLAGNYRGGISVAECVKNAVILARNHKGQKVD